MTPTVLQIQRRVAGHYGLSLPAMTATTRKRDVARPRQVAMYLAKRLTRRTLPELGKLFDRDHTTVLYGIRATEERRATDPDLDRDIRAIEEGLGG